LKIEDRGSKIAVIVRQVLSSILYSLFSVPLWLKPRAKKYVVPLAAREKIRSASGANT